MSRTTISLRQWLQLRQSLSSQNVSPIIPLAHNLRTIAKPSNSAPSNPTLQTTRSFHTTRSQNAVRVVRKAPSTYDKERKARVIGKEAAKLGMKGQLFLKTNVEGRTKKTLGECLKIHEQVAGTIYDAAIADEQLPKEISFKTYKDIGVKLIESAFELNASAAAVRAISVDVDAVFRIGHFVAIPLEEPIISEWILSSCAMAKARLPLVIALSRGLTRSKVLARSEWTAEIQRLAESEYPPAMLLHAKILGQRGEYESAFRIFEKKILPRLSPTRKTPSAFSNIQGIDVNDSPHRAYALLRAAHDQHFDSEESRRKADEAIRIAALEYNNPDALAEYASVMMNENNLDMYEECMCKAATAGHEKAAFYMANFYYLTYLGKYPTRGERDSNQNRWPPAWMSRLMGLDKDKADPNSDSASSLLAKSMTYLASFLNRSLPQKDYQRLALHWYILAWNQSRNSSAGFMMALLAREMATSDGGREDAGMLFEMAREQDQDPELRVHIAALEKNWFNPDYEATLPKKFMAVR